ncbi:MAG: Histidyl-tRNA synthetase [Leptospirillum sp. Group IV 'UBA BS']|nr:MAG: Histidyl-tRNA synthetase [Leptospirillum sp. Group IV 'UBA BS']
MKYQAPRGVKDLLPPDSENFRRLEDEIREVFGRSGFREVRLPIFESADLFSRSIGESTDIVEKEMYLFSGKGGETLALRPEGTASLIRAAIEHRLAEPGRVERLFYQGPMFRHERPQAGRLRQFHQAGAELLGSSDPDDDVDLIATVSRHALATAVPASRLLINSMGCPECRPAYREILVGYLQKNRELLCETCQRRTETNPLRVLDCKIPSCQPVLEAAPHIAEFLCPASRNHFERVCRGPRRGKRPLHRNPQACQRARLLYRNGLRMGVGRLGEPNPHGRRGDAITDWSAISEEAMCQGSGWPLALKDSFFSESWRGLFLWQPVRKFIWRSIPWRRPSRPYAHRILAALRDQGISAVGIFGQARVKKAFLQAEREGALFIGLVGGDELSAGTITLKHLASGLQKSLPAFPPEDLADALRAPWLP